MHAPLHLSGADMRGFFLQGDLGRLQAFVDAALNRAAHVRTGVRASIPGEDDRPSPL